MIDLEQVLVTAITSREVLDELEALVSRVVRNELSKREPDELVDVRKAAEILGMSEGSIRKRIERGQLDVVRIGRLIRLRRSSLFGTP